MKRALVELENNLPMVDSVIYMLDARAPIACINESFDKIIENKPILYVINKSDLIPEKEALYWEDYFRKNDKNCVCINSLDSKSINRIVKELKIINAPTIKKYKNKGVKRAPRVMVLGVPNCGKSTLINTLVGRKKSDVANTPGVTRTIKWTRIPRLGFDLLDSPGVLYPDFEDQEKAYYLAAIGSIKDARFDSIELAKWLYTKLFHKIPDALCIRYGIDKQESPSLGLENIAKAREYYTDQQKLDIERAAITLINDFRNGALGRVSLSN
jgi:ribosome biogenesis GTPase A